MGVNVVEAFLDSVAMVLNCKRSGLPFKYLGLPVGVNLKSVSTQQLVINTMQRRLASWKGKQLSLGGSNYSH